MSFFGGGYGGGYGGFGGGYGGNRRFEEQYHCYSVAYADKPHLEVSPFEVVVLDEQEKTQTQNQMLTN